MTDEEKKAIEYVKEFIEELQCDINMFGFEDRRIRIIKINRP